MMRPGLRLRLLNNVPPSNHMTREGRSKSSSLRDEWNRKRANKGAALLTFTALILLTVGVIMNWLNPWVASDIKMVTTNVQSLGNKKMEAETIGKAAAESAVAISDSQHVTTTDDIKKENQNTLKFHKFTLKPKEMYMWKGRQKKLCKHMQNVKNDEQQQQPLVAYAKVSCQQLHVKKRHGNFIYGLYAMHLAAMANGIDFVFECKETKKESNNNVFWWLQSRQDDIMETRALLRQSTSELYDEETLSLKDACRGMGKITLGYAFNLARAQLRNMAIGIFGDRQEFGESKNIDNTTMSSLSSSLQTTPLYPDEELDQVAIHFRCGDVLSGFSTINYGMVPFDVYRSALLARNTTYSSIGIVTQPFTQGRNLRSLDAKHSMDCKQIVTSLQNYLSHHFSHAKVTIRNSQSDTIPMVMSRLVLAEHTICIRSTFCVFPALATFGEATFLPEGVAYFVDPIARSHSNIHLLDSNKVPFLFSKQIKKLGLNKTIFWLEHKVMA